MTGQARPRAGAVRLTEGAQSIRRAVTILRAVASGGAQGRRLREIVEEVDLHVATTRRILLALVEEGMLQYSSESATYALGPMVMYFGKLAEQQNVIIEHFRPALREVARRSGDTVFLSVRTELDALCVLHFDGTFPIRTMTLHVGSVRPLGVGAGSLALLAWLPPDEREQILAANAGRYASSSLDVDKVRELATRSRKSGYTLIEGLILHDIYGIGIPIADSTGRITAAISVTAISSRLQPERAVELVRMVGEVCDDIPFWTVLTGERLAQYSSTRMR